MKCRIASGLCLAVGAALALEPADSAAETSSPVVAVVKKAWADRQARVKSGKFTIIQKSTYGKGSRTGPQAKSKGVAIPPEDVTFDVPVVVAFDGVKLRYEYTMKQWSEEKKQYWTCPYISTIKGNTSKRLFSTNSEGWPQGSILPAEKNRDAGSIDLHPILYTFRAMTPSMSPLARTELVEKPKCLIDGRECLVFGVGRPTPAVQKSICVDPKLDYSVVRITQVVRDKVRYNTDIRYQSDPIVGWVPAGWDIVTRPGETPSMYSCKVKKHELNTLLPDDYFDIDFPAGTWVEDITTNPPRQFLVKTTGDIRPIPPEDVFAKYEQIVNSEPGEALAVRPPSSFKRWLLGSFGIVALMVGLWYSVRARSSRDVRMP